MTTDHNPGLVPDVIKTVPEPATPFWVAINLRDWQQVNTKNKVTGSVISD